MASNSYHFVKVTSKFTPDSGYWYFVAKNVKQLQEHWEKYAGSEIKSGMRELVDNLYNHPHDHLTNQFAELVKSTAPIFAKPYMVRAAELENELYQNRLNDLKEYGEVWLSHELAVFGYSPALHTILKEVDSDRLMFPDENNPTLDDVRYIMWSGGKHWYAKIGKIDIVDEYGNQKWNTKSEAELAAKKYIEQNY